MARLGRPPGLTSTTGLYLPFPRGANLLVDASASALTVSQEGSGSVPTWAAGPFGDALQFGTGIKHLSVPAITFSGSLSVGCWVRCEDGGNLRTVVCQRDQAGSQISVFRLAVSNSQAAFTIYNAAATSDTVTATLPWPAALTRWVHVWACYDDPNGTLEIRIDGWRAAKKTTAITALAAATLPIVEIGGEASNVATSVFSGRLAHVQILSSAETSTDGLSPLLRPTVLERRDFQTEDLSPLQHLQDATWTSDGAGGYRIALSHADFTLGSFVTCPQDVLSVKSRDAGVETTYTEKGNVTDLDAGSNCYFVDMVNSQLYVSEDPATLDVLEVAVRLPVADRGLVRGSRYYLGALLSSGDPERGFAYPGESFQTQGGGTMTIAANHPSLPDGWTSEEAGAVVWTGARVFGAMLPAGGPWSSRIATFGGYVDHPPTDGPEAVTFPLVTDPGALHMRAAEAGLLDLTTYPNIYQPDEGQQLHIPIGYGILRVPAFCVDARPTTVDSVANLFQYKWSPLPCARLRRFGPGTGSYPVYHVSLADCTLWSSVQPVSGPFTVDVDGLSTGTPSTATSSGATALPFGTLNDLAKTPDEIIQAVLTRVLSLVAADYDQDTFDDTDDRALAWYRYNEPISASGSLQQWLGKALFDALSVLFSKPYTEARPARWAFKDVNKSASVLHTLRDVDILSEDYPKDYGNLASRLEAKALVYWYDSAGALKTDVSSTLALDVDDKYVLHRSPWDGGLRGAIVASQLDAWLTAIRGLFETPRRGATMRLSRRYLSIEQMDVASNASTQLPTGLGARFRPHSVKPSRGSVDIRSFPETPFPASGLQAAPTRSPVGPFQRARLSWPNGVACTDAGAWPVAGTLRHPMQGGWGPFPAAPYVEHILVVRAQRTGGAGNTDAQVRLRDATAGTTIATLTTGVGTTVGNYETTTFTTANFPAGDAELEVQYQLAGGATLEIHDVTWWAREITGVGFLEDFAGTLLWGWGTSAGIALSTQIGTFPAVMINPTAVGGYIKYPTLGGMIGCHGDASAPPPGSRDSLVIRADGTGATNLRIGLVPYVAGGGAGAPGTWQLSSALSVAITGGDAFYSLRSPTPAAFPTSSRLVLAAQADVIGASVFYSIGFERKPMLPVR